MIEILKLIGKYALFTDLLEGDAPQGQIYLTDAPQTPKPIKKSIRSAN